jgi:hypothetical protein
VRRRPQAAKSAVPLGISARNCFRALASGWARRGGMGPLFRPELLKTKAIRSSRKEINLALFLFDCAVKSGAVPQNSGSPKRYPAPLGLPGTLKWLANLGAEVAVQAAASIALDQLISLITG